MPRLDQDLLRKIAKKTRKRVTYIREQVSKRAARNGISSEAELIRWARQLKIGTGRAFQALPAHLQAQASGPAAAADPRKLSVSPRAEGKRTNNKADPVVKAIPALLSDAELHARCADLLKRPKKFDRAVVSATTVLEARIRTRAKLPKKVSGVSLVVRAINSQPSKAILVVSDEKDEQEGFFNLCKGVMAWFRNESHHHLDDELTREQALRLCAFVDLLLQVIDAARVQEPT